MKAAVFLDRDGVINDNGRPVNKPEELVLFKGACEAIKQLNDHGYDVYVVTNQGGVGCGYMTEMALKSVHEKMERDLALCGAVIKEIAACIHHPKSGCNCRKPLPGMITNLAKKHDIDLARSFMVGDLETDCQAGRAAGVGKNIKIGEPTEHADYTVADLSEAVQVILGLY